MFVWCHSFQLTITTNKFKKLCTILQKHHRVHNWEYDSLFKSNELFWTKNLFFIFIFYISLRQFRCVLSSMSSMSDEEKSTLYRVRKTVLEMLVDRKYAVPQAYLKQTQEEFAKFLDASVYRPFVTASEFIKQKPFLWLFPLLSLLTLSSWIVSFFQDTFLSWLLYIILQSNGSVFSYTRHLASIVFAKTSVLSSSIRKITPKSCLWIFMTTD